VRGRARARRASTLDVRTWYARAVSRFSLSRQHGGASFGGPASSASFTSERIRVGELGPEERKRICGLRSIPGHFEGQYGSMALRSPLARGEE
jgi:hypothetical protein